MDDGERDGDDLLKIDPRPLRWLRMTRPILKDVDVGWKTTRLRINQVKFKMERNVARQDFVCASIEFSDILRQALCHVLRQVLQPQGNLNHISLRTSHQLQLLLKYNWTDCLRVHVRPLQQQPALAVAMCTSTMLLH